MVPVWKEKMRLNAVFLNKYKMRFVAALNITTLIKSPWLGLPYIIYSSKTWWLELNMIFFMVWKSVILHDSYLGHWIKK